MKLNIKERLIFARLLPPKNDIITMTLARDIKVRTELTQEDIKAIDLRTVEQSIKWNDEKAKNIELEVEFSDAEKAFLKEQVARLDKAKEIDEEILDLCVGIREL